MCSSFPTIWKPKSPPSFTCCKTRTQPKKKSDQMLRDLKAVIDLIRWGFGFRYKGLFPFLANGKCNFQL